jgi:hypothetical protein
MSTSLKSTVESLAASFAHQVLDALRSLSLEEILAASRQTGRARAPVTASAAPRSNGARAGRLAPAKVENGRLARRSAEDIDGAVDRIVAVLKKHRGGLRAEQLRAELGVARKELPRPIARALADRRITKKGEKRATTYFAH